MDAVLGGKVAVVGGFGFLVCSNLLSLSGYYGADTATVSREVPTYITPDGVTFAIWGLIYSLQLGLVVSQCCPTQAIEGLFAGGARYGIAMAFFLNGLWLPAFSARSHALAFLIIVAYLTVLLGVVSVFNTRAVESPLQWAAFVAPNVVHASWVAIATMISFFTLSGTFGWQDEFGVAGTPRAALLAIVVLTALAAWLAVARGEVAWALVVSWALAGVFRRQTGADPASFPQQALSPPLALGAEVGALVALLASAVGLFLLVARAQTRPQHPQLLLPQPYY